MRFTSCVRPLLSCRPSIVKLAPASALKRKSRRGGHLCSLIIPTAICSPRYETPHDVCRSKAGECLDNALGLSSVSGVARQHGFSATPPEIKQRWLLKPIRFRVRRWTSIGGRLVIGRRGWASLFQRALTNDDTGEFATLDVFV